MYVWKVETDHFEVESARLSTGCQIHPRMLSWRPAQSHAHAPVFDSIHLGKGMMVGRLFPESLLLETSLLSGTALFFELLYLAKALFFRDKVACSLREAVVNIPTCTRLEGPLLSLKRASAKARLLHTSAALYLELMRKLPKQSSKT